MGVSSLKWTELLQKHVEVIRASESLEPKINEIGKLLANVQDTHGKVLICGNGGSFAHAQHLAAEMVVRYRKTREPMRAIALGSNPSITSAICNDLNASDIFVREAGALMEPGDCVVAFSTSGKSPNVLRVLEFARGLNVPTVGITGKNGMAQPVDYEIRVPSDETAIIQQVHTIVIHALCELIDA